MENNFGWTDKENKKLFAEVKKAQTQGKPLNRVFERIAKDTGRKANSIRNYYYQRVKTDESLDVSMPNQFISFSDKEVFDLVKTMLVWQAQGKSVRRCALDLGNNDRTKMLRYQNKYRSIIKHDPALVDKIINELEKEGVEYTNPYKVRNVKKSNNKSQRFSDTLGELLTNLQSSGVGVDEMFSSLNSLAKLAARNADLSKVNDTIKKQQLVIDKFKQEIKDYTLEKNSLLFENAELMSRNRNLIVEGEKQKQKYDRIFILLDKLLKTNREFLGLNEVSMVTDLSSYIDELSKNISYFEELKNLG